METTSKLPETAGYKEKYEKEHKAFEDYKADVDAKETRAAKEKAVTEYLKSKNVQEGNLKLANPPKNTGGTMTKDQIMAIKDRDERRAAIAANMSLFEKGE